MQAEEMVLWVNHKTKEVSVELRGSIKQRKGSDWGDPIGGAYLDWREASDADRVRLMLETIVDLACRGFDAATVVKEMSKVEQFKALGRESHPMCRAITKALTGRELDMSSMTFDELLEAYGKD